MKTSVGSTYITARFKVGAMNEVIYRNIFKCYDQPSFISSKFIRFFMRAMFWKSSGSMLFYSMRFFDSKKCSHKSKNNILIAVSLRIHAFDSAENGTEIEMIGAYIRILFEIAYILQE